jgi:hypothetical protein
MTGICQDAYFEEAVREVEAEAAAEAVPAAPAPPPPHQEPSAGELDSYLARETQSLSSANPHEDDQF